MNALVSPAVGSPQAPADPAAAFERMSYKIAGLTAAIEGFAARQQELHARDYGADLAKIHDRQDAFNQAILDLAERPGVRLTAKDIASQIDAAGAHIRARDQQAWAEACRTQQQSAAALDALVASALTARRQWRWIYGAASGAFVLGVFLCAIIPGTVDRSVPASWLWPEQRAAGMLRMDGWPAGARLMQVSDPRRWRALNDAAKLAIANADAIKGCRDQASRTKKEAGCIIQVQPIGTGE